MSLKIFLEISLYSLPNNSLFTDNIIYFVEQLLLAVYPLQKLPALLPEHPDLPGVPVFCSAKGEILTDLAARESCLSKNTDQSKFADLILAVVPRAVLTLYPCDQAAGFIALQLLSRDTESLFYLLNRHLSSLLCRTRQFRSVPAHSRGQKRKHSQERSLPFCTSILSFCTSYVQCLSFMRPYTRRAYF